MYKLIKLGLNLDRGTTFFNYFAPPQTSVKVIMFLESLVPLSKIHDNSNTK